MINSATTTRGNAFLDDDTRSHVDIRDTRGAADRTAIPAGITARKTAAIHSQLAGTQMDRTTVDVGVTLLKGARGQSEITASQVKSTTIAECSLVEERASCRSDAIRIQVDGATMDTRGAAPSVDVRENNI